MYVSMKEMLDAANKGGYAVMAINCFNLETARSVIRAAEAENAPIIINIFAEHLLTHSDSELITPIVRTLAQRASVDVALNLDHGQEADYIKKAVDDGFSSVMVDASRFDLESNIKMTKELADYAHARGVSVEGEIGCLGASEGGKFTQDAMYTDPAQAKEFVERTGIDALAVSIGTSHGNYPDGMVPKFDIERLKKIKELTGAPLVLHGGSGSGDENLARCARGGVAKVNLYTDFIVAALAAVYEQRPDHWLKLLGAGDEAMREVLRHYYRVLGCVR